MSRWIKYDKCVPAEDDYYLVYRPKYEPPIAVAIYDSDLGGGLIMRIMRYLTGNHFQHRRKINSLSLYNHFR